MKKVLCLLLILCTLALTACGFTKNTVELTQRIVNGSPTWIFDFTYTNETHQPLTVVALEILTGDESEQITGQGLINEGYALSTTIAPKETYSIYLTSENLLPQPEYTFVLTLRKPDNTCFSHVVNYVLTDIDPDADYAQEVTAPKPGASVPSGDIIVLEPENGTDWHFIFDFLNETGEAITLQQMEVVNYLDGAAGDVFLIPGADLPLPSLTIAPNEPFQLEDWHGVVEHFNGRTYTFTFTKESGGEFVRTYTFELRGGNAAPAQPQQPQTDPDAPADALLPVFADNEYHWQFISTFVNEHSETLTFSELHIVDHLNGQMQGDTLLTVDNLQHIQRTVEPGQTFLFEDWHPVVDHMDERHYVFIFTTPSGQAVEYPFEYPLSMDTTQQRAPVDARAAALPVLDYANDDGKDLIALRHDAAFGMQVAPDVFWVPAADLGQSAYSNRDIYSMLSLSPEEKQARIRTLYEALQLYEISGFTPSDDNVRISENGVNWEHHKPGYYAVVTNTGCCATDSNWLNYILRDDYEEVGFIATSQRDGGGHIYNYIRHEGWYYFIDLTSYRAGDSRTAIENGDENSYYSTDFVLSNIHKATSLQAFVNYVQDMFNDPPGLMFQYTASDCLAVDSVREQHGITILYGVPDDVNVNVIFDDPSDSLYSGFTQVPSNTPDWSKNPVYSFPQA